MSAFNLPPGCSLSDVDGSDECPVCEGSGEQHNEEYDPHDPESELMIDCEECAGLGVRNKRSKKGMED